uniref:Uncharacterized protein n=1 Tax=Arundo donax TaxID=35708 RepID=A0A0A9GWN5_ARUDO
MRERVVEMMSGNESGGAGHERRGGGQQPLVPYRSPTVLGAAADGRRRQLRAHRGLLRRHHHKCLFLSPALQLVLLCFSLVTSASEGQNRHRLIDLVCTSCFGVEEVWIFRNSKCVGSDHPSRHV